MVRLLKYATSYTSVHDEGQETLLSIVWGFIIVFPIFLVKRNKGRWNRWSAQAIKPIRKERERLRETERDREIQRETERDRDRESKR